MAEGQAAAVKWHISRNCMHTPGPCTACSGNACGAGQTCCNGACKVSIRVQVLGDGRGMQSRWSAASSMHLEQCTRMQAVQNCAQHQATVESLVTSTPACRPCCPMSRTVALGEACLRFNYYSLSLLKRKSFPTCPACIACWQEGRGGGPLRVQARKVVDAPSLCL